jgi:hypothetical protein
MFQMLSIFVTLHSESLQVCRQDLEEDIKKGSGTSKLPCCSNTLAALCILPSPGQYLLHLLPRKHSSDNLTYTSRLIFARILLKGQNSGYYTSLIYDLQISIYLSIYASATAPRNAQRDNLSFAPAGSCCCCCCCRTRHSKKRKLSPCRVAAAAPRQPAKTAYALGRTIKHECVVFAKSAYLQTHDEVQRQAKSLSLNN